MYLEIILYEYISLKIPREEDIYLNRIKYEQHNSMHLLNAQAKNIFTLKLEILIDRLFNFRNVDKISNLP